MTRAPLRLLLCASFALVPLAALAADPNEPNDPLFSASGNPCFAISADSPTVSAGFSLDNPNDPGKTFYSHLPDCTSVCKKVGASCAKFA
ncbi:MAG: hypothetical protein ACHQ6T_16815, partial [Myxococcota bacterium]